MRFVIIGLRTGHTGREGGDAVHWGAGALEGDRGRRAVSGVPAKAVTGGWKRRFVGQALAVTKRLKGSRGQLTASASKRRRLRAPCAVQAWPLFV